MLLAFDTATAATTVALASPDKVRELTRVDGTRHAEHLTPMIAQLFADADLAPRDLAGIVVGVGPGPFTGLRVGIATAIAMSHTLGIPLAGLSTLDVLAYQAGGPVTVATRARRVEVFWADYDEQGSRIAGPLALTDEIAAERMGARCAGDAARGLLASDDAQAIEVEFPSAASMISLLRERFSLGETWPLGDVGPQITLEDAASQGGATSDALSRWTAMGRVVLPALPLYLRRPDAVATAQR
jgi:tRNA threonylcarbamoyl adenosine modification protein YeaZ